MIIKMINKIKVKKIKYQDIHIFQKKILDMKKNIKIMNYYYNQIVVKIFKQNMEEQLNFLQIKMI